MLQFYKAARECLTYAEIGDYISCHPDPNSETTLLGLNKDTVHKNNPHYKVSLLNVGKYTVIL